MRPSERPVVIVTGASKGIGAATARWLASHADVVMVARSREKLEALANVIEGHGGSARVVPADLAASDAGSRVVEHTVAHFGRLDSLVNNAGTIEPIAAVASGSPAAWRDNLALNLFAPVELCRSAIPHLRQQRGRIVNVSSGAAILPIHSASAYCAAKAALNHFTRVLAEEEPSITAMCLRPGVVDTDMQGVIRTLGPGVMPAHQSDYYQELKQSGKLEPPEIPGRVVAWLALQAPRKYSGEFLRYDNNEISAAAMEFFGDRPGAPSTGAETV